MKKKEFLSAGEAARALGVSVKTIQRWDKAGLLPVVRTATNQRRIPIDAIHRVLNAPGTLVRCAIYARVSSAKQEQEGNLTRQGDRLQQAAAERGYQVVALTGKSSESEWLKKIGAAEVMLRQSINLEKIRPLDKASWAGAVDNLGGEMLAWIASTMKENGVIASVGLAASFDLHTTVMPFILRGVSLLGINSGESSRDIRDQVWQRLASDLKPPLLKEMCRTIPFRELPGVFDDFINARVNRRIVVDLSE